MSWMASSTTIPSEHSVVCSWNEPPVASPRQILKVACIVNSFWAALPSRENNLFHKFAKARRLGQPARGMRSPIVSVPSFIFLNHLTQVIRHFGQCLPSHFHTAVCAL